MIVSGGTSSGKTTLLNAVLELVDPSERLMIVEDNAELAPRGTNTVRLEALQATPDQPRPVHLHDLVRTALRLRPDRLVVGEVRGDEVLAMVQALNTGHDGSWSTCHANSALDALVRLETLILQAAPNWPLAAIRRHLYRSVDVIVQTARTGTAERRIVEIAEVRRDTDAPDVCTLVRNGEPTGELDSRAPVSYTTSATVASTLLVFVLAWLARQRIAPVRRDVVSATDAPSPAPSPVHRAHRNHTDLPRRFQPGRLRGHRVPIEQHLGEWCGHAARSVRGGASLSQAILAASDAVPPLSATFGDVVHAQQRGHALSMALAAVDTHDDSVRLVVAVVRTCARLGGPAAEPLDRTAAVMHARLAAVAERRVQSAQARLSAVVLTVTPVAVLMLLVAVEPSARKSFRLPVTWICLTIGLALNVAGWFWMRRIISGGEFAAGAAGCDEDRHPRSVPSPTESSSSSAVSMPGSHPLSWSTRLATICRSHCSPALARCAISSNAVIDSPMPWQNFLVPSARKHTPSPIRSQPAIATASHSHRSWNGSPPRPSTAAADSARSTPASYRSACRSPWSPPCCRRSC